MVLEKAFLMKGTSGLFGKNSSKSVNLTLSLANRLMRRLEKAGSIQSNGTWRAMATRLHHLYFLLEVPAHHMNDTVFGSLPTPRCSSGYTNPTTGKARTDCLTTTLIGKPILGMPPNPLFVAWMMGYPLVWASIMVS